MAASAWRPRATAGWIRSVPAPMNLAPVKAWLSERDLPPVALQELPRNVEATLMPQSMSRDNILHKVRTALGRSAGQAPAEAPPVRLRIPEVDNGRAHRVHANAHRSAGRRYASCGHAAGGARAGRGSHRRQNGAGLELRHIWPSAASPRCRACAPGSDRSEEMRDLAPASEIGITSADYALADTGTLVMIASPAEARLVSLLPPAAPGGGSARTHPHRARRAVHDAAQAGRADPVRWC